MLLEIIKVTDTRGTTYGDPKEFTDSLYRLCPAHWERHLTAFNERGALLVSSVMISPSTYQAIREWPDEKTLDEHMKSPEYMVVASVLESTGYVREAKRVKY